MDNADLTIKQRKWLASYLETGNATQAVIDAGYEVKDRASAQVIGSQNLDKLNISDALEEYGISTKKLIGKLNEGLDATKKTSEKDVEDYPTRHKYLETALKLKKLLVERQQIEQEVKFISPEMLTDILDKAYGTSEVQEVNNESAS